MRLELTLCKETIKEYFSFSTNNINLRTRISNNILVVSNELINIWENSFDNEDLKNQFRQWFYMDAVLSQGYVKKVKLCDMPKDRIENNVIIDTCDLSRDKIIIGESNIIPTSKRETIKFINNNILNIEKKQRIKVEDINNIFIRSKNKDFFSLYETPITIDVKLNSDSLCLAKYLSIFYKESKNITIKDVYLDNEDNLRNLRTYILPFINKEECEITLLLYWEDGNRKRQLERIFNNIDEYKVKIKKLPNSSQLHESFIEGDKYKLNIGYRLKLFGDRDDGLTEQEVISITRK